MMTRDNAMTIRERSLRDDLKFAKQDLKLYERSLATAAKRKMDIQDFADRVYEQYQVVVELEENLIEQGYEL